MKISIEESIPIPLVWHYEARSEITYHAMATAPLLIRSSSGFSQGADYIRYGPTIVDYTKLGCLRRGNNILVDESYSFNQTELKSILGNYLERYGTTPIEFGSTLSECDQLQTSSCNVG
jgi:hypothetical protein